VEIASDTLDDSRRRSEDHRMRPTLIILAAVACGSPPAAPTVTSAADPHRSREALVREIVTRLGEGNADRLAALVPHEAALARVLTCDRPDRVDEDQAARRVYLQEPAKNFKGLTLDVLAIANNPEEPATTKPAGEVLIEGCTLSVPVRWEALDVRVRVRGSAPRESSVWVNVYEIAGRWYLVVMQEKPS
jgi:hypothetical protein